MKHSSTAFSRRRSVAVPMVPVLLAGWKPDKNRHSLAEAGLAPETGQKLAQPVGSRGGLLWSGCATPGSRPRRSSRTARRCTPRWSPGCGPNPPISSAFSTRPGPCCAPRWPSTPRPGPPSRRRRGGQIERARCSAGSICRRRSPTIATPGSRSCAASGPKARGPRDHPPNGHSRNTIRA